MKANRTAVTGVVVGVIGAALLALFVAQSASRRAVAEATTEVFVVGEPLAPGMTLDAVRPRLREATVPQSIAPQRRVLDLGDLAGQEVLRPVGVGEVLTVDQFAAPGPAAGGLIVPAGYEAVAVEADPAPGVEGYVTPGSRVNVYAVLPQATGEASGGQPAQRATTQLVLGHLDVLAVTRGTLTGESQPTDAAARDGRIMLLLQVRPVDAPVLVQAQSQGSLWFSLVNRDDPPPVSQRVTAEHLDPALRTGAIAESRQQQDAAAAAGQGPQ